MDFNHLWQQVSKEELWKGLSAWWQSASRARVVLLLAMRPGEAVPLPEIVAQTGESIVWLTVILNELEQRGVVVRQAGEPPRYRVGDEQRFLEFIQECCQQASTAAGHLSTLAQWAQGRSQQKAL